MFSLSVQSGAWGPCEGDCIGYAPACREKGEIAKTPLLLE